MSQPKSRRTLEDIERYYTPKEIYSMIVKGKDFQSYATPFLRLRNNALCAMCYLTAGRITEVLSIKGDQIEVNQDFIVIRNMIVVKHRKNPKTGEKIWRGIPLRPEVLLPRKGVLAQLTNLVYLYLQSFGQQSRLFPFTRRYALDIINCKTGKWPHWFRAQGESYLAQIMGDDLARYLRVNPASINPYRQPDMNKYRKEMLK